MKYCIIYYMRWNEKEKESRNNAFSLAEITGKLDAVEASNDLSANELDMIIHESHSEYGRK